MSGIKPLCPADMSHFTPPTCKIQEDKDFVLLFTDSLVPKNRAWNKTLCIQYVFVK